MDTFRGRRNRPNHDGRRHHNAQPADDLGCRLVTAADVRTDQRVRESSGETGFGWRVSDRRNYPTNGWEGPYRARILFAQAASVRQELEGLLQTIQAMLPSSDEMEWELTNTIYYKREEWPLRLD